MLMTKQKLTHANTIMYLSFFAFYQVHVATLLLHRAQRSIYVLVQAYTVVIHFYCQTCISTFAAGGCIQRRADSTVSGGSVSNSEGVQRLIPADDLGCITSECNRQMAGQKM